jgi:uncharacterized metal-binding protein
MLIIVMRIAMGGRVRRRSEIIPNAIVVTKPMAYAPVGILFCVELGVEVGSRGKLTC